MFCIQFRWRGAHGILPHLGEPMAVPGHWGEEVIAFNDIALLSYLCSNNELNIHAPVNRTKPNQERKT